MTNNRRFELLKDLPDGAKVGDIYEGREYGKYHNTRLMEKEKGYIEHQMWDSWQVENNPAWFKEVVDKEWEILSWYDELEKGVYTTPRSKIHSVKRLSDGEVFSVGDEIEAVVGKMRLGWIEKIKGFEVVDEKMVAVFPTWSFPTWRQPMSDLKIKRTDIPTLDRQQEKIKVLDIRVGIRNKDDGEIQYIQPEKYKECLAAVEKILNP